MNLSKTLQRSLPVLHPFLFTLFPILSLYASNVDQVLLVQVLRPVIMGLLAVGLLLAALGLLLRDWQRAGLAASLASVLFFNFGLVYKPLSISLRVRAEFLAVPWIGLFLLGLWWIIRRAPRARGEKRPLAKLTRMLNNISALALATCLWGFAAYGVQAASSWVAMHNRQVDSNGLAWGESGAGRPASTAQPAKSRAVPGKQSTLTPAGTASTVTPYVPPDIYYIILDGYGREDVLNELYNHDNRPFIEYLEDRGFYVAGESYSNYPQTALSLASSLNYDYLHEKIELDPESESRLPLTTLIQTSTVQSFLKDQGYRSIAFTNGFPVTELQTADDVRAPEDGLSNFEISLLSGSLGAVEWDEAMLAEYRDRVQWTAEELERVVNEPGPKFVFVHVILPHPPFVFHDTGDGRLNFSGGDGSHYQGTTADYIAGYRGQLLYTNALARRMIESILANSTREPVILLQGDHGPGAHLDWEAMEESCLKERFSILNAYYLPGTEKPELYPGISPVNSFRVILNRYFDAGLELLPDRSYYATWQKPYNQTDVTGRVGDRCIIQEE